MKKISVIVGSIRKKSYNLKLANIIKKEHLDIDVIIEKIDNLPFFNEDLELNLPEEVIKFKENLKNSDSVIIITPEYNYSISGVLKNALDWVSRGDVKPFINKPVAILSASLGKFGGVRAQNHLRDILRAMGSKTISSPEVFVGNAYETLGKITDEETLKYVNKIINKLKTT